MTTTRKIFYTLSLVSLALASGCSNKTLNDYVTLNSNSEIITDPPGARVVVDDKEVGTTPMKFEGENIFPPHWEGTSYMVKSKLVIKKPGCKTVTQIIKDPIPEKISITLDCQQGYMAAKPQAAQQAEQPVMHKQTHRKAMPAPAVAAPVMSRSIEERLIQVQNLHKKGLISDAENAELRKKILKGLE